jgi:conjugative transfer signal peptidase TraF
MAISLAGIGAVLAICWPSTPGNVRLVFNPTTSAPAGWYILERQGELHVDDYVLAQIPVDAMQLASERRYLPISVPILKRIGAIRNQFVCISDNTVFIDSRVVAQALRRDWLGRDLTVWTHCRALASDELFLLSITNPASFDSRYFGPIHRSSVIAKARPLWTW